MLVLIIISILFVITLGVYFYSSSMESENETVLSNNKSVPVELQDCSRVPGQIKKCPDGYFCYESISGGLGPEGQLPIEHLGGDNKCYKLCEGDSDCLEEAPHCIVKRIRTEDYVSSINLCFEKDCAGQGDKYYNDFKPDYCCEGLTDVYNPASGYISVTDKCYYTANKGFLQGGHCSNCGNGICEDIESVCGCPEDCEGKRRSDYETVQEFCNNYWDTYETIRTRCETWDSFKNNPICNLCQ